MMKDTFSGLLSTIFVVAFIACFAIAIGKGIYTAIQSGSFPFTLVAVTGGLVVAYIIGYRAGRKQGLNVGVERGVGYGWDCCDQGLSRDDTWLRRWDLVRRGY